VARAAAVAAFAVLALVVTGCGSGVGKAISGNADMSRGKQLFLDGENGQPACATCHTLAEANASGKVGPDLDASFGPDRKQGFKEETIRQVVADQIRFPGNYGDTGPTMPKNLVTGEGVDDVAAYVAYVAGKKGVTVAAAAAPPSTTTTGTTPPPSGGGGADLAAGKKAFGDNGCAACHTLEAAGASGKIGPDLDKLKEYATQAKKPEKDFIHESIADPNAYVQPGYPKGVMPDFSHLPKSTLDALVAFLSASAKG
jgi:mono/diheme cytochrome c family protein